MPIFGGSWDSSAPPVRSGLFFNVVQGTPTAAPAPAGGVVALVAKADWGPVNTVTAMSTKLAVSTAFGTGQTMATSAALAFRGSNTYGASQVLAYRIVGANSVKASLTLNKTGPVAAIVLSARYQGTRANGFTVTVRDTPADAAKTDIVLYEGSTILETHTYADAATLAAIVVQLNTDSSYFTATTATTGSLLTVTGAAFTSGFNGDALTSTEYGNALSAFEAIGGQFSMFCLDDYIALSDGIKTTIAAWVARLNAEGSLFLAVVGGALAETTTTAKTRSTGLNSEYVVNTTRDLYVDGVLCSSSVLAPLVAGCIAGVGVGRAISLLDLPGCSVDNPPTITEVETLVTGGVIPFIASDAATTRIQRGRTSLVTLTSEKGDVFQSILQVRKIHHTLRALTDVYLTIVGAGVPNNAVGRGEIMGSFKAALLSLSEQGIVNPDWTIALDADQDNSGETLHVNLVARPAPTVEVVLGTWVVPTA